MTARSSPDLYSVGWITALPIELAAATAMLDEAHPPPLEFVQHQSDTNVYKWGRMGEHNVVIASLAAGVSGTTSAANTASGLIASLPRPDRSPGGYRGWYLSAGRGLRRPSW